MNASESARSRARAASRTSTRPTVRSPRVYLFLRLPIPSSPLRRERTRDTRAARRRPRDTPRLRRVSRASLERARAWSSPFPFRRMRRRRANPTRVTAPPRPQPRVATTSNRPGTSTTRATRKNTKPTATNGPIHSPAARRPTDGVARPGPETWRGSVHRRAGEFRKSRGRVSVSGARRPHPSTRRRMAPRIGA